MASQKRLEPFLSGFESRAIEWLGLVQYGSGSAPSGFEPSRDITMCDRLLTGTADADHRIGSRSSYWGHLFPRFDGSKPQNWSLK